ncbi:glutathione S-transferase 1-like [Pieris rapae]|uniref:glutathione S-transferase 1-like n=1 Tax=Pieris rapae TaxID=64459 RepID=UPI001E27F213|nr:glutathione S-transferase 1-like [Pieris rapae]
MVLTLYKCDLSPPVRSVLMVIEHLKLPVQFVDVNFIKGEQLTEEYKKINPQHTVPTLIDDDFILGDSHAISMYLINKYAKDDSLYPSDPKLRAIVDQRLHFDSGILFPVAKNGFGQVVFQGAKKMSDDAVEKILSAYEFTDQFATNTWLAGEQFTIADICCVATISSLNNLVPIDAKKYPRLYAWLKRCSELDIYKKMNAPGNEEIGEIFRSKLG